MTAPLHEVLGETQSGRRRASAKQPNAESLEVFERGPWQAMLRDSKSNGKLSSETWVTLLSDRPACMSRPFADSQSLLCLLSFSLSVECGTENQPGHRTVQGHQL